MGTLSLFAKKLNKAEKVACIIPKMIASIKNANALVGNAASG